MRLPARLREADAIAWVEGPTQAWLHSARVSQAVAQGLVGGALLPPVEHAELLQARQSRARLRALVQSGLPDLEALEVWTAGEARLAADFFLPLYERSSGRQGWVSVAPTSPDLEALERLWSRINRPNVVLRLPANAVSLEASETALGCGLNIHLTDIFSLERVAEMLDMFLRALERRRDAGAAINHVAAALTPGVDAVARKAEEVLQQAAAARPNEAHRFAALRGRTAYAISRLIYAQWRAAVEDQRFRSLAAVGAQPPLLVWHVPSAGSPAAYVAAHTALAVPASTLLDPTADIHLDIDQDGDLAIARAQVDGLLHFGISLADIVQRLERDSLRAGQRQAAAFLRAMGLKLEALRREAGPVREDISRALREMQEDSVVRRLWQKDPSLWSQQPEAQDEIRNRLGWLDLPADAPALLPDLLEFAGIVRSEGLRHVVLLGMGGSSLAADVLRRTLAASDALRLHVLDTTDPDLIHAAHRLAPMQDTLYLAASKSGTTVEVLALLEHFWEQALRRLGREAGRHFAVLTDPGTPLESLARESGFRRVFSTPEEVGGRYSALTAFGILPAALAGVDLESLLQGALRMAHSCRPGVEPGLNLGAFLGAALAAGAARGLNQVTFLSDPGLDPFEDWIEQLLAESSGKDGRGLLAVVHEPPGPPAYYRSQPRIMLYLRRDGRHDARASSWMRAGLPVIVVEVEDGPGGLGAEFLRWEVATAIACHRMGVNAFDQPDVQRAKTRTAELLKAYHRKGSLPDLPVLWEGDGARLLGECVRERPATSASRTDMALWLLDQVKPGEALVLLLYLTPSPTLERTLARLRRVIRDRRSVVLTPGIGPRYLHSTGQLHKGGPSGSTYLIVTCETRRDIPVPGTGHTFGVLRMAQALGDLQALHGAGRTAYGLHLDRPARLLEFLGALAAAAGSGGEGP